MRDTPKPTFPHGSLLAAMLGGRAPTDVRRAAHRLRAEGAAVVAVEDDIAGMAPGLATSAVARSPAVLDVLPPLFWVEARLDDGGVQGWVMERKRDGLSLRGFAIGPDRDAVPEPRGTATLLFGVAVPEEDEDARFLRGLVTAVSLQEMLSQMGEASPVVLLPAEAAGEDLSTLRGLRLSVAMPPDALPD